MPRGQKRRRPDQRTRSHAGTPKATTFGALLRAARSQRDLTQTALAARAGIKRETISLLERGYTEMPDHRTLHALVHTLGISSVALLRALDLLIPPDPEFWVQAEPELGSVLMDSQVLRRDAQESTERPTLATSGSTSSQGTSTSQSGRVESSATTVSTQPSTASSA